MRTHIVGVLLVGLLPAVRILDASPAYSAAKSDGQGAESDPNLGPQLPRSRSEPPADFEPEQEEAVAHFEKLGCTISKTPVVSLRLGHRVTDADLVHLKGLPNLRELYLNMTQVTNAGLAHVNKLTNLQTLELVGRRQKLTTQGLIHLKDIKDLRSLTLTYMVNDGGLAHLKNSKKLQSLSLTYMDVTDEDLHEVKGLTDLETLFLFSDSRITDVGMQYLGGLRRLRVFILGSSPAHRNRITNAGLAYLAGLTNLETLSVSQSLVTDAGLVHLKKLTNLKWLGLNGSLVTDQGLAYLQRLKNLKDVLLYGTQVTEKGVASVQRALPKAKIRYGPHPRP
jgi:hypothetical protein